MPDIDQPAASSASFQSFVALQRAHLEFKRSFSDDPTPPERARPGADDIRRFISHVHDTGAFLGDESERRAARAILDYWSAKLVTSPDLRPTPSDFMLPVLATFDAKRAAEGAKAAAPGFESKADPRSREIIRLVASARQWQASGRKRGYLLTGDALREAAQFRHLDPDIAALVAVSEAVKEEDLRQRANRRIVLVTAAAVSLLIHGAAFMTFYMYRQLPSLGEALIAQMRDPTTGNAVKVAALERLQFYQQWLPPLDLSNVSIENVSLPNLDLKAPNFSLARFRRVAFPRASLANASFSESRVEDSDFNHAQLSFANFRSAEITSSLFDRADLQGAIFDRACLGDVKFSGANLRNTSFWAVTFSGPLERAFQDTAWWFAQGWNSSQIAALRASSQRELKESLIFKETVARSAARVAGTRERTFERAFALNDRAWTLATWGVDPSSGPQTPAAQPCEAALKRTDMAENALDAAEQAVCIVETLSRATDAGGSYDGALASFRDTQAYILMQLGRMSEAARLYAMTPASSPAEVLFRSAVAHYAIGEEEKAKLYLERSIAQRYTPTHELQHLNRHFTVGLRRQVFILIDEMWPPVPPPASCLRVLTPAG